MPSQTLDAQQLTKKVKLFEAIVNRTHDAVLVFSHQLEVIFANPAANKLMRAKPGTLRGKPLSDFIPEDRRSTHEKQVKLFNIGSEDWLVLDEWRRLDCRRADGTLAAVKISMERLTIGGEQAYVVALKDMAECLKLEKEKSVAELRHFQAAQQQRWAGDTLQLSLEGAIKKIAKAAQILKDTERSSNVQEAAATIQANAFAALSMGQKAAFFSDNSNEIAGAADGNIDPFKLVDRTVQGSLDRIRTMVGMQAQQKNLQLKWQVPAAAREFKLENCSQVEQIFFNIAEHAVSNAIGGEIQIDLASISYGANKKINMEFECRMTQFGIAQQVVDRMLSAKSSDDMPDGTNLENNGMRLRLAKHLTEKMGGKMRVVSHPQEGTKIFVKLSDWELGRPERLHDPAASDQPDDTEEEDETAAAEKAPDNPGAPQSATSLPANSASPQQR